MALGIYEKPKARVVQNCKWDSPTQGPKNNLSSVPSDAPSLCFTRRPSMMYRISQKNTGYISDNMRSCAFVPEIMQAEGRGYDSSVHPNLLYDMCMKHMSIGRSAMVEFAHHIRVGLYH